jgi:hypothetical protein
MKHNDIDELTRECEEAERLYQEAMKARHMAVSASQEALKVAARARRRLMRASVAQGEGDGNDA